MNVRVCVCVCPRTKKENHPQCEEDVTIVHHNYFQSVYCSRMEAKKKQERKQERNVHQIVSLRMNLFLFAPILLDQKFDSIRKQFFSLIERERERKKNGFLLRNFTIFGQ